MTSPTKSAVAIAGAQPSKPKGDRGFKSMAVRAGRAYLRALRRNGQSIGQASFFAF